jgi:hypothetical protein
VERILKLDCNVTDFYAKKPFPCYLIYNPHTEQKKIVYETRGEETDLFDILTKSYLAKSVNKSSTITLPADEAVLIMELPSGTKIRKEGDRLLAGDKIVSFQ